MILAWLAILTVIAAAPVQAAPIFRATLSGDQEVPPVDTEASGFATFETNAALDEINFELHVFDIFNVTAAHIHLGPPGVNGPVVVWLFPDSPPAQLIPGEFNGLLASGSITAADLVDPLEAEPLEVLLAEMTAGNTYVNVHTQQFPGGEIRGQIAQVSEPGSLAILAVSLLAVGLLWRRRANVKAA